MNIYDLLCLAIRFQVFLAGLVAPLSLRVDLIRKGRKKSPERLAV